mmetsp:Transcript_40101/g.93902  ORF Transcript_40101/g.93902 Transcript_40101/m.93902 type:complete len:260 (+) Transcript_40101:587-1366(+)
MVFHQCPQRLYQVRQRLHKPRVLLPLHVPDLPSVDRDGVETVLDVPPGLLHHHPPHGTHSPRHHPRVRPQRGGGLGRRLARRLHLVHRGLGLALGKLANRLHGGLLHLERPLEHAPLCCKQLPHRPALRLHSAAELFAGVCEGLELGVDHLVVVDERRLELGLCVYDDGTLGQTPPPALDRTRYGALCRRHVPHFRRRGRLVPVRGGLHGVLHVRHSHPCHVRLVAPPLNHPLVERHAGLPLSPCNSLPPSLASFSPLL